MENIHLYLNLLLLILGMIMEILPIMLILAPILFPLLTGLGVDEVHFGVVMVLNLMIGMITPPIGQRFKKNRAVTLRTDLEK